MELMITVAIIAILARIAYPSYQQYILKSHRADAKTALLDLAARQERFLHCRIATRHRLPPSAMRRRAFRSPFSLARSRTIS